MISKNKKHEDIEMSMKQQEIVDTMLDIMPTMVIASMTMKMLSDAYRDNPNMFWSYFKKQKCSNLIYNCRM